MRVFDRVKVVTNTVGTGVLNVGAPENGFQSFQAAGVQDTDVISYVIEDGMAWEIGWGVWSNTGPTLTRNVVASSNGNAQLNLSGSARIFSAATRMHMLVRYSGSIPGKPAISRRTILGKAVRAYTISQSECSAQAVIAAAASYTLTLKKRSTAGAETTVGTFVWSASGTLAVVTITNGRIDKGDMLYFEHAAVADANLFDIAYAVSE